MDGEGDRSVKEEDMHMIVVVYYPAYLKKIAQITRVFAAWQEMRSLRVVVNNPAISESHAESVFSNVASHVKIIRHDNEGLEFGAYQRGLNDLRMSVPGSLACLFANDTLGTHQPVDKFFLRNLHRAARTHMGTKFIAGRIDSAVRQVEVNHLLGTRWVRSNLFVMDDAALASIDHVIYAPELNAYINDSPDEDFFFGPGVARSLRRHISGWLLSTDPPTWYKAEPLSVKNHAKMANKARSILQELFFSMRLANSSTGFVQPSPLTIMEKIAVKAGLKKF
ncbi:MAG: hypothetical protein JWQ50_8078 [Caballeronia mineralivorans]|jgi:hypothetical protein|nr:hypothetical protein [Caballeronia mineralivorans]